MHHRIEEILPVNIKCLSEAGGGCERGNFNLRFTEGKELTQGDS